MGLKPKPRLLSLHPSWAAQFSWQPRLGDGRNAVGHVRKLDALADAKLDESFVRRPDFGVWVLLGGLEKARPGESGLGRWKPKF